tara:strand:+ start:1108 stop:1791 length:684 start_codon:yes stop_codon:yes gene_type:complete
MGISTGIDYYLAYQFVKKLSTPFKDTEAYKLGIIDEKGKVLKKRSQLSSKERDSYKLMDTLIFNLKKFLEKLPGGKSKIGSLAAALMLIKEERTIEEILNDDNLENKLSEFINSQECYDLLLEYESPINKYIKESGPTVVTTGQAGLDKNPPGPRKFAGARVFKVPTSTFLKARMGKKKYEPYRKILGEIENGEEIRQYGRKYYKEPIILEDERTGAMCYLRYGKKG